MAQDEQVTRENMDLDYNALVERVTEEINDLPDVELMSGDRFQNLWEEIAYQVQVEESYCFRAYKITVEALCQGIIEELPEALVPPLWLLADARYEWDEDDDVNLDTEVKAPGIGAQRDGVAEELIKRVWQAAANYDLPSCMVDDSPMNDGSNRVIVYGRENLDYEECVEQIIEGMRDIVPVLLQSRDSSPYEDAWKAYAAQVQGKERFPAGLYENLLIKACYNLVEELSPSNLLMLWQETDAAVDWCDGDPEPETSEMQEAVAEELFQKVNGVAADYDLPEIEDDNEESQEGFVLKKSDHAAIQVATKVLRLFLSQSKMPARKVVGLGKALYALERLPAVTPGAYCDYGICYRSGDEKFNEMKYISFLISENEFAITTGGSVYDQSVGGDSITGPWWRIELGGFADRTLGRKLYELEDVVREYLSIGAEITVEDLSEEIDMDGE